MASRVTNNCIHNRDGGWGLLPTVVVIVVLSLLGAAVLKTVDTGLNSTGTIRRVESTLNITEAGVAFGMERLRGSPFLFGAGGTDVNTALNNTNAPLIDNFDTHNCTTTACPLFNWHELTPGPVSFDGGTYRVAVRDDLGTGADTNNRILLRSLGTNSTGIQRLIEVVLELN